MVLLYNNDYFYRIYVGFFHFLFNAIQYQKNLGHIVKDLLWNSDVLYLFFFLFKKKCENLLNMIIRLQNIRAHVSFQ